MHFSSTDSVDPEKYLEKVQEELSLQIMGYDVETLLEDGGLQLTRGEETYILKAHEDDVLGVSTAVMELYDTLEDDPVLTLRGIPPHEAAETVYSDIS